MKNLTAVLITACITFISTLIISSCIEYTVFHNRNQDRLNGLGGIFYIGEGIYEMVDDDYSYFLYSRYANQTIISNGLEYTLENGTLYFYSEDGYAIVYPKSNLCKTYFLSQQNKTPTIVTSAEYPRNKLIVYLDSFEEYTEYEQKMLNNLVEKHNQK